MRIEKQVAVLAFFSTDKHGASDPILTEVARHLQARHVRIAGAVQVNVERADTDRCDMELHILTGTEKITISQNLGRGSRGCRLEHGELERAVGLVVGAIESDPALLVVNKFGKQECEGRGFRPLIGEALSRGIPVLTSVPRSNRDAFAAFSEGCAEELAPDVADILQWFSEVRASNRVA